VFNFKGWFKKREVVTAVTVPPKVKPHIKWDSHVKNWVVTGNTKANHWEIEWLVHMLRMWAADKMPMHNYSNKERWDSYSGYEIDIALRGLYGVEPRYVSYETYKVDNCVY
jgi:hypothetical protein